MSPRHGNAVSTIFSCGKLSSFDMSVLGWAAIYVESRVGCTDGDSFVDNRQRMYVRSIIALSSMLLESGGNRTQDQPKFLLSTLQTVFVLMETSHHP